MKGELFDYQEAGVDKFVQNDFFLNADEMGLGKSCQSIVAIERMHQQGKAKNVLIVVPATLKYDWQLEIQKFTDLTSTVIDGPKSKRTQQWDEDTLIKIVNYELILRDEEQFMRQYDIVILDEAHRLKNYKSKIGEQVKYIPRKYRWALTGTPVQNLPTDLHSVFDFLHPFYFGHYYEFKDRYMVTQRRYYKRWQDGKQISVHFDKVISYKNLDELHQKLKPVFIRRLKTDVFPDMPEKIVKDVILQMQEDQRMIYDTYHREFIEKLKKNEMILGEVTRLRLLCDGIQRLSKDNIFEIQSVKLDHLSTMLDERGDSQIVIFTNWLTTLRIIKKLLVFKEISHLEISGEVNKLQRSKNTEMFRNKKADVMLCTGAAEEGVNLQTANIEINFDVPWTDAALMQRHARIHRIGQTKTSFIYNLYCKDTIEDTVRKILTKKKNLAFDILDNGDKKILRDSI